MVNLLTIELFTAQPLQIEPSDWLDLKPWKIIALFSLLMVWWLIRKIQLFIRRRRPARIHPKLQKYGQHYGEPDEKLTAQQRMEAEKILATSSSHTIAGYNLIEQVEAVYVDGFRRPEEAIEGLKAVAAMKGANALTNVMQNRTSEGTCAANGDAVIVQKIPDTASNPPLEETLDTDNSSAS